LDNIKKFHVKSLFSSSLWYVDLPCLFHVKNPGGAAVFLLT
jgi:hypothetical protein